MLTDLEAKILNQKSWQEAADNSERLIRRTLIKYQIHSTNETPEMTIYERYSAYSLN